MSMRLAGEEDRDSLLGYLKKDLGNCLYIYMDICKYGFCSPHMQVWVEEDGMNLVLMKYYDSLQLYAASEDWSLDAVLDKIQEYSIRMISARRDIIERLRKNVYCQEYYEENFGHVFRFQHYKTLISDKIHIQKAEPSDSDEIARLMRMDSLFSENYEESELSLQLCERMKNGMGRCYVIRAQDHIIAHIATFAEIANLAVTSGLIVHPEHRNLPYGTVLESYLVNCLQKEGIDVFTFVNERKRYKLLKALDCEECGQYGKLTRIG